MPVGEIPAYEALDVVLEVGRELAWLSSGPSLFPRRLRCHIEKGVPGNPSLDERRKPESRLVWVRFGSSFIGRSAGDSEPNDAVGSTDG